MIHDVSDKSATSDETIYVRHLIDEWCKKTPNMTELARHLGASNPEATRAHLSLIRDGDRGTGLDTWELFAAAYHNGSIDDFRRAAARYAATKHAPVGAVSSYISRAATLEWMLKTQQASQAAIATVGQMRLGPDVPDPGPKWWQQRVEEVQRAIDGGQPPPPVLASVASTGGTLVVMRRPIDWLGLRKVCDTIIAQKKLHKYHAAAVGFSEELTTIDRPDPLTVDTVLPLLDRFTEKHPKEMDPASWSYWRREARKRLKVLLAEQAARERNSSSKLKRTDPTKKEPKDND